MADGSSDPRFGDFRQDGEAAKILLCIPIQAETATPALPLSVCGKDPFLSSTKA